MSRINGRRSTLFIICTGIQRVTIQLGNLFPFIFVKFQRLSLSLTRQLVWLNSFLNMASDLAAPSQAPMRRRHQSRMGIHIQLKGSVVAHTLSWLLGALQAFWPPSGWPLADLWPTFGRLAMYEPQGPLEVINPRRSTASCCHRSYSLAM